MSMTDPDRLLNEIRIATPCTASWEAMTGTDTVRFCGECRLNVYNISNMTAVQAATLIDANEGRLCVRLYRRSDGTVITKDCPVGVRRAIRRMAKAAGAALALVIGLVTAGAARSSFSQSQDDEPPLMGAVAEPWETVQGGITPQGGPVVMGKVVKKMGETVTVTVAGPNGGLARGAVVTLEDLRSGSTQSAEVEADGRARLNDVEAGVYSVIARAEGFAPSRPKTVRVRQGKPVRVKLALAAEN